MEGSKKTLDRARFLSAWRKLGAESVDNADEAFESVLAHYSGAARSYHDLEHINECLAWLDQAAQLAMHPAELELAIVFHDIIYEPLSRDNEARSAELLRRLAQGAGMPGEVIARIEALILSTAEHRACTPEEALMSDIDLAILGAERERFARFEQGIRSEYQAVEESRYRAGRKRVLSGFLARESIYQTSFFRARLEQRARENLSHALGNL